MEVGGRVTTGSVTEQDWTDAVRLQDGDMGGSPSTVDTGDQLLQYTTLRIT